MFIIGIFILKKSDAQKREQEAKEIEAWEFITIPKNRRNDLFYVKLSYQYINTLTHSRPLSIYSKGQAWASLSEQEINRLNNAALCAEDKGSLSRCGYAINRKGNVKTLRNRVVKANKPIILAKSNISFIFMISNYDYEKGY